VSLAPGDVVVAVSATQGVAAIGRVIEAGERADGMVGQRVLVGPIDPCGECDVCRAGGAAVCASARRRTEIGERVVAAARWLVPLANGLDVPEPAGAAVAGDVALAYTLYARTGPAPRDPVVIVGASPIARFLVEIVRAKGIVPVVVADPALAAWRAWLEGRGAAVVDAAGGIAAVFAEQGMGSRPWRVIATTAAAVADAAAIAGPRATLTVLAPIAALPGDLASREVTVIAVAGAHPDLVVEVAAMCVKGEIDLTAGTAGSANAEMRAIVHTVG
jgi:L-idonate 5-dehydrogenase